MSEKSESSSSIDVDELKSVLGTVRMHLDDVSAKLAGGETPNAASLAARLRALEDTNTSCQNSGCGGLEALKTLPADVRARLAAGGGDQ